MSRPDFPAGPQTIIPDPPADVRADAIARIRAFPAKLRALVEPLTPAQLGTVYKKWTIRQIVNHLADSHTNGFIRTKWALTEDAPTIKPYRQWEWSQTPDGDANPTPSLAILAALHARWADLLAALPEEAFRRTYVHPEGDKTYRLGESIQLYAWHGEHHAAQIELLVAEFGG